MAVATIEAETFACTIGNGALVQDFTCFSPRFELDIVQILERREGQEVSDDTRVQSPAGDKTTTQ